MGFFGFKPKCCCSDKDSGKRGECIERCAFILQKFFVGLADLCCVAHRLFVPKYKRGFFVF